MASTLLFGAACAENAKEESGVEDQRAIAFRDDCGETLGSLAETKKRIESAKWNPTTADSHPKIAGVMQLADGLAPEVMKNATISYFGRKIAGSNVYLVVTHLPSEQGWLNGCYLYDFDATKMDETDTIRNWLGVAPTEVINYPGQIQQQKWIRPARNPKLASVRVGYVSGETSAEQGLGFSGAVWAATALAD